jgi:hypothetical protein
MATSGSSAFNLQVTDLVEEAFERCGAELRSGYDLKTAIRSLNLLTVEWSNRGINMWTIEQGEIPLVKGQNTYDLPIDTIDLLDQQIRTNSGQINNQTDITISRISVSTYATIPNKLSQSRPIQVWIQRMTGATYPLPGPNGTKPTTGVDSPKITVWPTPDQGTLENPYYVFVYWRMRRIQDAGGGINTQDIPFRFLNCMVAGLAYYLSLKLPNVDIQRVTGLKADYEQQLQLACDEDREKAPIRFIPRQMFIGNR